MNRSGIDVSYLHMKLTHYIRIFAIGLVWIIIFLSSTGFASTEAKIDLFGYYFLEGKIPELQEIELLHLSTIDVQNNEIVKVPLYGFIRFNKKGLANAELKNISLRGKIFSWKTKAVKGTTYQFTGKFQKLGDFPMERPDGEIILEGSLIKTTNLKRIFDGYVKFTYYGGD